MTGLIVEDPGFFTTVQDTGRPGYREWGVPLGGAFDRASAAVANALLGNAPGCALLEMTIRGGIYLVTSSLALALAGAPMEAKIVGTDGSERRLAVPSCFPVTQGERLVLGRMLGGARTYLAARDGWRTRVRLGSRSSEEHIVAGVRLPGLSGTTPTRYPSEPIWVAPTAEPFRIIDGPDGRRESAFDAALWAERGFRVGSHSNRMGLRLEGESVTTHLDPERLSAPVAPGAIQVAGGQLIILGVASGTMGGYPHVADVISADLDRLGQLKPGDPVSFHEVTLTEARALDKEARSRCVVRTLRLSLMARDA